MTTMLIAAVLLAAWVAVPGAAAQDRNGTETAVRCGADWITFVLPPVGPGELRNRKAPVVANAPTETVHTIRKANVRNLVLYSDTGGGEIVFFLETGSAERPRAYYSGLVPGDVHAALAACLD